MSDIQKLNFLKDTNPHWSTAFFEKLKYNRAQLEAVFLKQWKKNSQPIKEERNVYEDLYADFLDSREHQDWMLCAD